MFIHYTCTNIQALRPQTLTISSSSTSVIKPGKYCRKGGVIELQALLDINHKDNVNVIYKSQKE